MLEKKNATHMQRDAMKKGGKKQNAMSTTI